MGEKVTALLERYIAVILRRRRLVVALSGPFMLAMLAGAQYITVTNDYNSLFEEGNPQLAALHALEDTYATSNAALIAVAPKEGSVFTREALGAIEELTEAGLARALFQSGGLAHQLHP